MVIKTRTVCSWCQTDLATGEKLTDEEYHATTWQDSEVSHGLCATCLTKHLIVLDKAKADLEKALVKAAGDTKIADSMREYWTHKADGAEQ